MRYFRNLLDETGVELRLDTTADAAHLTDFDETVVASGVHPRIPDLPGIDHAKALSYIDVLASGVQVGQKVAIIGAGGLRV